MLIWSLGIPYFQLPLSGSPPEPQSLYFDAAKLLSTPSLGITEALPQALIGAPHNFQLPLSGSLEVAECSSLAEFPFNSLSRDHFAA